MISSIQITILLAITINLITRTVQYQIDVLLKIRNWLYFCEQERKVIFLLMQKYEIIDVIDQGAYGIVWKAVNRESGSMVAIKEFKEGDEDQFSRKTIQRQIKMLKMLKGDFVVGIKQAFKKKGKIYLIFQYFQRNLLNLIEKYQHGLDPKLINVLIYKIIKCIQYLHSKNIIHRDVKPQNLLLNSDYSILKICDFGFARFLPQKQYDLTDYVATRWYRSPQLLVGEPYGKPADIWAVGCMIGQLVDCQPMFPGDDQLDQLYLITKLIGDLTTRQRDYFHKNPKFDGVQLPEVKRVETIEMRYLGKIQKNALNFMKACLKIDQTQRMTIQQALKHPYLINLSLQDNQFTNDQTNLLQVQRKNPVMKNDSKASLFSIKDDQEKLINLKSKFVSNSYNKNSLKLEGGSMNERDIQLPLTNVQESDQNLFSKKKSHTNLQQTKLEPSPQKLKIKKMSKMMSEEKNLKVNVDLNVKINLKINQKSKEKRQSRDIIQAKLNPNQSMKNKLLPQIKNNSKGMRYQLNIRHQKVNPLISVIGETKQLIKGTKLPHN